MNCPFCKVKVDLRPVSGTTDRYYIAQHLASGEPCEGFGVAVNRDGIVRSGNMVGFYPEISGYGLSTNPQSQILA